MTRFELPLPADGCDCFENPCVARVPQILFGAKRFELTSRVREGVSWFIDVYSHTHTGVCETKRPKIETFRRAKG